MARPAKTLSPPKPVLFVQNRDDLPDDARVVFEPQPGPQTEAYHCQTFMILYGGARFGGKTYISIAKTLAGNPDADQTVQFNVSYVFHPAYRALVLRKNYKDLLDYKDRAAEMYSHFGGKWNSTGSYFEFPPYGDMCAKVVLGHLDSDDAYQIYQGQQYCRIFIEEVTQIKSKILFLRVVSSCRSKIRELRPQVFLTANPEGAGFHWVREMFMTDPQTGLKVPPNTRIVEKYTHPITGEEMELDRIFIPAKVWDNKIGMADDPTYVARLMSLPDSLRRAYLDGDWDAISGSTFFSEFRPKGPLIGEPAFASHCVDSAEIYHMPWQRMWCGLDWGFGHYSACYWFFENDQDKRIYVCDEMVVTGVGSYDLGLEWARRTLPYFSDPDSRNNILVYMSPDMWQKRDSSPAADDLSIVSRFAKGIEYVLGKNAVYVPGPDEMPGADLNDRLSKQRQIKVVLVKAPNHRVTGWGHCRELLDWKAKLTGADFDDRSYLFKIMNDENWKEKYTQWIRAKEAASQPQTLPRMRIFRNRCPRLITGIEAAVFAENREDVLKVDADAQLGKPGDDEIDAWRYGCSGWTREKVSKVPIQHRWLAQVRNVLQANPDMPGEQLSQVRHAIWMKERERERKAKIPVLIPRRSSHWERNRVN